MSEGAQRAAAGIATRARDPFAWAVALVVLLGAAVYLPLFFPESPRTLAEQGEGFFFQANEAAGGPVLLLALWLFYRRSHYLDLLRGPGAPGAAAAVLLASAALFGWGVYTAAPDLRLASGIGVLAGSVLLLGGAAGLRAFWLPIAFLVFALPVPPVWIAATIFPIQLATAQYTGWLLSMAGIDAVVQGDLILRPEASFIVVETCSGVRTMVTLAMLAILMIDLFERRGWHAALLFALTPVVAFAVNGFRVVTLVLNPHSDIHSIHNLQGIAMLLVGLLILYGVDGLLARASGSDDSGADDDYGTTVAGGESSGRRAAKLAAVAALLGGLVVAERTIEPWHLAKGLAESPDALLERVFGDDLGPPLPLDYKFLGSASHLAQARRPIRVDGSIVEVFLGVADEQRRDVSVLTPRLAWPASGYDRIEARRVELEDGRRVTRSVLRRGERRALSWSWVERRGAGLREFARQAAALDRSPLVRPQRMLSIRLATGLTGPADGEGMDLRAAEDRLESVWRRLAPALEGYAPTRRPARDATP